MSASPSTSVPSFYSNNSEYFQDHFKPEYKDEKGKPMKKCLDEIYKAQKKVEGCVSNNNALYHTKDKQLIKTIDSMKPKMVAAGSIEALKMILQVDPLFKDQSEATRIQVKSEFFLDGVEELKSVIKTAKNKEPLSKDQIGFLETMCNGLTRFGARFKKAVETNDVILDPECFPHLTLTPSKNSFGADLQKAQEEYRTVVYKYTGLSSMAPAKPTGDGSKKRKADEGLGNPDGIEVGNGVVPSESEDNKDSDVDEDQNASLTEIGRALVDGRLGASPAGRAQAPVPGRVEASPAGRAQAPVPGRAQAPVPGRVAASSAGRGKVPATKHVEASPAVRAPTSATGRGRRLGLQSIGNLDDV